MKRKCIICGNELLERNRVSFGGKDLCFKCSHGISGCFGGSVDFNDYPDDVAGHGGFISPVDITPRQVYQELSKYVVGQDEAKRVLANAAYTHYVRTSGGYKGNFKKSNILLYGPTGCGKTYLVQTLANILDVPLVTVSATSLTEAGYEGEDVNSIIERLYAISGNDAEKASRGIVFIDEIDKLCVRGQGKQRIVGVTGVQQELLTMMEGTQVKVKGSRKLTVIAQKGDDSLIDTSNILFICGGAFPDLEDIVKKRLGIGDKKSTIGFGGTDDKDKEEIGNIFSCVAEEDLREFGMIPEFAGRVPVKVGLEGLTLDLLRTILSEPENSLLAQYQSIFAYGGVSLEFEEDALCEVAKIALDKGVGARGLRGAMEQVLSDILFQVTGEPEIEGVSVTRECVLGTGCPVIRQRVRGVV